MTDVLLHNDMDIPESKRDLFDDNNVRWLLRNLAIRNKNHPEFKKTVCKIVETHTGKLHANQTTTKYSSKGKFVSLTVRIIATSRQQLDAINTDLQSCPLVLYLL